MNSDKARGRRNRQHATCKVCEPEKISPRRQAEIERAELDEGLEEYDEEQDAMMDSGEYPPPLNDRLDSIDDRIKSATFDIMVNIADLKDPNDPEGRSYRQVNASKTHQIPIGSLVETKDGCRAWVVSHNRDCDMTPLYALSLDKEDTEPRHKEFANPGWSHGWPEHGLRVVR